MVAVSGLQLLLLSGRPVLPGQVPHASLVLELPALVTAQLHIAEQDLLIRQFRLQVLQLLPLPLGQVFSARLLAKLGDLGQGGRVKSPSYPSSNSSPRECGKTPEEEGDLDTRCSVFPQVSGTGKASVTHKHCDPILPSASILCWFLSPRPVLWRLITHPHFTTLPR